MHLRIIIHGYIDHFYINTLTLLSLFAKKNDFSELPGGIYEIDAFNSIKHYVTSAVPLLC